jgi:hypothetical protein
LADSPKLPKKSNKIEQIEQLLNNTENMNRQSMGGGEILRMILMDSKQYVDNEDPVRPKTGLKAHDISEIDSLIFADQQPRSDDEP